MIVGPRIKVTGALGKANKNHNAVFENLFTLNFVCPFGNRFRPHIDWITSGR